MSLNFKITPPLGQLFYVNFFNTSKSLSPFIKSFSERQERVDNTDYLIITPPAYIT